MSLSLSVDGLGRGQAAGRIRVDEDFALQSLRKTRTASASRAMMFSGGRALLAHGPAVSLTVTVAFELLTCNTSSESIFSQTRIYSLFRYVVHLSTTASIFSYCRIERQTMNISFIIGHLVSTLV